MGMRIGHSASAGSAQGAGIANWQQRQQAVKDLLSAVQSGDLGTAQKAYSGLTGGSSTNKGDGPLAQLGKALQAGDIAAAQQAAQAWQSSRSAHGHHAAQPATTSTPTTLSASGPGSIVHVTA